MKNWTTLESDRVKLLNKHFTPGHGCDLKELIRAVGEHEQ